MTSSQEDPDRTAAGRLSDIMKSDGTQTPGTTADLAPPAARHLRPLFGHRVGRAPSGPGARPAGRPATPDAARVDPRADGGPCQRDAPGRCDTRRASRDAGRCAQLDPAGDSLGCVARPAAGGNVGAPARLPWAGDDRPRRGCGNAVPVEITERFPPGLGNLAEEREIPTFPQPPFALYRSKRKPKIRSASSVLATNAGHHATVRAG